MPASEITPAMRRTIGLIIVGVIVWGVYHAIGAAGGTKELAANPWRGVVVAAFVAAFVLWWWWLLSLRQRKSQK